MEKLVVRKATEPDCPLILEFIKGLAAYEKLAHEVVATEESLRQSIFERKRAHVLIAEYDGVPAAFCLYFYNYSTFMGRECLYLEDLYVKDEFRGKGIGKTMFHELASIAVEEGCPRLDWVCLDWNESALDFYKNLGAARMDSWLIHRLQDKPLQDMAKQ